MLDNEKEMLRAERRGRALAMGVKPGSGQKWRVEARETPDGAALLAAARWARRFGADVQVAAREEAPAPPFWNSLAEYLRREGILRRASEAPGDVPLAINSEGLEMRIRNIPSDAEAWGRSLDDSWRMAEPASDSSSRMGTAECRALDDKAINRYGVAGLCLMENAALAAMAVARDMLMEEHGGGNVVVAAGGGNNGGDGLAVARGLNALGVPCEVALFKPAESLAGDAGVNYRLLRELSVPVHEIHDSPEKADILFAKADLVVDALLGTGFKGRPSAPFHNAIESINHSGKAVLALDLPSGLDGDVGAVADVAVRAARTITFAAVKHGLERGEGALHSGRVYVGDIGAPAEVFGAGEDEAIAGG